MVTRKNILVIAVAVLVVIGGAAAGVLLLGQKPPHTGRPTADTSRPATVATRPPDDVPVGAESTVRLLLSARGREALTPELNATLPHGSEQLFPTGSTFTPIAGGWHQAGAFANLTGALREPGKAAAKAEVGLVDRHGRWLVTFEGKP
jgi:hypothetical protein